MWSGAKTGLPEKRLAKGTLDREPNAIKRDEIAAPQLHALRGFVPIDRKLRLSDIKELFEQMRDWRKQKGRRSTRSAASALNVVRWAAPRLEINANSDVAAL